MTDPILPPSPTPTTTSPDPAPDLRAPDLRAPDLPPSPTTPPASAPARPPGRRRGLATWVTVALMSVLAVGLFMGGAAADRSGWFGPPLTAAASVAPTADPRQLALVEEAWRTIHDHYVDAKGLDDRVLVYGAIQGMTQAVGDEGHTTFLTAEQAKAFDQGLSGSVVGIGVQISADGGAVIIGSVIPGTPAEEAGLRRGDGIAAVDGKTTQGEPVASVASRVRGPEGETVRLTIDRSGTPSFDVTITRRKFDVPTSSWSMVPGRTIAVIRLERFAAGGTKEIEAAITKAKEAGATAIVLDLRGNPGGYAGEAVSVASQFIGDGIVYQSTDASGVEKDHPVKPGGLATDIPLVVLADGGTASSGEIVTGAIQDAKRAQVVGEKTFGTGTVTLRFDLADGSSLRIGVEHWLTRAGRPIWHEGLQPDVTVALPANADMVVPDELRDMSAAQLALSSDMQLLKALELLKGDG